jgi:endonuclease/exonuclease/phosphatase family metal-dependent hydrolase
MPSRVLDEVRIIRVHIVILCLNLVSALLASSDCTIHLQSPKLLLFGNDGVVGFPHCQYASQLCTLRETTTVAMMLSHTNNHNMINDTGVVSATNNTGSLSDFVEITDDYGMKSLVSPIDSDDGNTFQFIRLEKESDSSAVHYLSSVENIAQKIKNVRDEQNVFGCADLYVRQWESHRHELPLFSTEKTTTTTISFTALQFNILAEGLSSCPGKRPFQTEKGSDQRDVAGYGGFTSIPHPSATLDFELRRWRLVEILFGPKLATPYDIIALEEVDRYRGFFRPLLTFFGYDSVFMPKKNAPGVRMGWYSDGCVLAWKSCTFDLIHKIFGDYSVGNQIFIIVSLKHKISNQRIVVAVTHLKAQQSEVNEVIRCRQVDELLVAIDDETKRLIEAFSDQNVPVIILGDFNADPPTRREMNCSAIQKLLTHAKHSAPYRSAYTIDNPMDDLFTTWKIRGTKTSKRFIDYIFHAGSSIQCVDTLKTISPSEIEETKLPSLRHPSDHLHIAAKFEINLI